MAVVGVTTGPHAPDLKTKENMYGDAMVELTDHEDVFHDAKLGLGGDPDAQPAGIRPSDSWLDVTQSAKERRGMHVTFQVRDRPALCLTLLPAWTCHQLALHTPTSGLSSLAHNWIMHNLGWYSSVAAGRALHREELCEQAGEVVYLVGGVRLL